jgi:prepilin-type N-terminal cleavage/methylation domain-containing protein
VLTRPRLRDDDAGFTLVELLMSVVILGIIAVPLAGVVIGYLKNAGATSARMSESHDAQMAAAYFAQDVQALGTRDYSDATTFDHPLLQSVETGVAATGGTYPCGPAGTPDAVVRLAWDDWDGVPSGSSTAPIRVRAAYVLENGTELHRLVCRDSSAVVSDVVVAHDLVSPFAAVTCTDGAGVAVACTGAGVAVPGTVSLRLTIHDPHSAAGSTYSVTLTGQRRQT